VLIAMDQRPFDLRPADPTFEDGLAFAHYLDVAAEGFYRIVLGRHAAEILAAVFTEPDHDYSFQNVLFAEEGEAGVGMAEGFAAEPRRRLADQPLRRAAGRRAWRMLCVAASGHPLLRIHSTLAEGDFYLQALAVDEGHRGQGIGSALIDCVEERARDGGSLRLAVDASARNERARRLYERHGMTVVSRWPKRFVIPGFGLLRMTKPLRAPDEPPKAVRASGKARSPTELPRYLRNTAR
jgi:ribosomal protein S18 acetylase RimI-like enzyme